MLNHIQIESACSGEHFGIKLVTLSSVYGTVR
jgi:hypothetical protein